MDTAEKRLVQPMPDRIALGQQPSFHFPEFRASDIKYSVSCHVSTAEVRAIQRDKVADGRRKTARSESLSSEVVANRLRLRHHPDGRHVAHSVEYESRGKPGENCYPFTHLIPARDRHTRSYPGTVNSL
jgi:hypothetical protein